MRKTINSYTFKIGTGTGEYPAGSKITSALFAFGKVTAIFLDNVSNTKDFDQNTVLCSLDLSGIGGVSNNNVLTVLFENPIEIKY